MPRGGSPLWLLLPALFLLRCTVLGGFECLNNPCVHGVCIDDLNSSYSCYCIDGYTGIQCQINWDECWSNPCQNGATCMDGIASFNCSCPSGFVGELCEEDFNECDSNPCLNNGSCIDSTNGYECNCITGYTGTHCEIDIAVCNTTNEARCANGGICIEGAGATFSCRCQPGWGGFFCESEIDECMSAPCQNGAVCIDLHADYACACLFGKNCEEIILRCEDNPCKNSALCLTEDGIPVCYCVPDYHGDRCQYQYDECELGPRCMNGGTCIDGIANFTCSCPPDLTGDYCECLIVGQNQLDCTYTVTAGPTTTSATITTLRTSETSKTITETTLTYNFTTMMFTQVPNVSITEEVTSFTALTTSAVPNTTLVETTTEELTTEVSATSEIPTETPTETVESTTTSYFTTEMVTTTAKGGTSEITLTSELTTIQETTSEILTESSVQSSPVSETSVITTELPVTSTEFPLISTEFSSTSTTEFPVTSTEFSSSVFPTLQQNDTISTGTISTYSTAISSTEFSNYSTLSIEHTPTPTLSLPSSESPLTLSSSTVSTFLTEKPTWSSTTTEVSETTTAPGYNTTKPVFVDCSKSGCKNGGTCLLLPIGYKCVCPFNTAGPLCEVTVGVKNAAFGGDSYLTHRLLNNSGTDIEFTTKTLSPSGLIFYSNIDTTYMALYLENGYLKFIFSCGFQTMLLSELRNAVNNGFDMNIKAKLQFNDDFKQCNATVMVNDTLTMSGNQVAVVNQIIKRTSILHLGGLPQEKLKEHLPKIGFMGCISNLKIFGKKVNVFKDAEDGFKVAECASLACLSSPCGNGGTCVESEEDWHCLCKNGYSGKLCETSACDNNPCLFGATCLPYTGSGYICLCPFGKHGHFCEYDMEITEPNFSSTVSGLSSYAAYPIPTGISINMELKFKFIPSTMDQISILMFIGQEGIHDASSDHMAVSFVKGYIMLTWNLGSGPRRIFTSKPIEKGKGYYMLQLGRWERRAWLAVEGLGNITGRSPGNLAQLDVVPVLYLGGHNSPNFSILPHDLPLHTGFLGCIYDVELKSGDFVIPLQSSRQVIGRALGQCGTTLCHEQLCQNGGACLHHGGTFACLCQDGWFGPLCSSRYNPCDYQKSNCSAGSTCVPLLTGYECDCPVGRTGKFCEKDEKLSDVSFMGRRSYIILQERTFEATKFSVELQIRVLGDKGLVLFVGHKGNSFLSLSIQGGLLELRVLPAKKRLVANEIIALRSNKLLAMGIWYSIKLGKYGSKFYLQVDNSSSSALLRNGEVLNLSGETIYLGGLPDMSKLPPTATPTLPIPFTGCIRQLKIDSRRIPLTTDNIVAGQNIADCDGTPCGGDYCENGGTCWLDFNLKPYCSCLEPFAGAKCEDLPSCTERPCQNRGKCVNSKCFCVIGYTGAFCETAITVQIPEFSGDSHLILRKVGANKRRDLREAGLSNLYLNFTTPEPNGLILWSRKGGNFIGIGVEKCYLKLAYSFKNQTVVEIVPAKPVCDGLWHSVEVYFKMNHMQVHLDKKSLQMQNSDVPLNSIFTDVFYLGGVPKSQMEKTSGLFPYPFFGCVETISFNKDVVKDFTLYDGQNIGVCSVY